LGSANGLLLHYVLGPAMATQDGCVWGAALGAAGGVSYALLERTVRGAAAGQSIGSMLGLLYGLIPGVAAFFVALLVHGVVVTGGAGHWFLAASMVGMVAGGVLDRLFDAVLPPRGPGAADRDQAPGASRRIARGGDPGNDTRTRVER
jgi:hypothetical protein